MVKTFYAVYEHGVIKPLEPIKGIEENTELEVVVSTEKKLQSPLIRFAGILSNEEADNMMKVVDNEFERINPDDWKD